jgi:hypothetical protein
MQIKESKYTIFGAHQALCQWDKTEAQTLDLLDKG